MSETPHDKMAGGSLPNIRIRQGDSPTAELEAQLRAAEARVTMLFEERNKFEGLYLKYLVQVESQRAEGLEIALAGARAVNAQRAATDEALARLEQVWRNEADRWDAAADEDPANPMAAVARRDARTKRECAEALRALRVGT